MSETILVPKKLSIRMKPYGSGEQLWVNCEAETLFGFTKVFSTFVTNELCEILMEFLEREKFMRCRFDEEKLISINNRLEITNKPLKPSQSFAGFEGVPLGLTLYATRNRENLYTYVKVGEMCLNGYVSVNWCSDIIKSMINKDRIIFSVADDKKERENFKTLLDGMSTLQIAENTELPHVAYYGIVIN